METKEIRRRIGFQAACLLHNRQEATFHAAKWRAARAITRSHLPTECLPTDFEIRMALQELASLTVADGAADILFGDGQDYDRYDSPAEDHAEDQAEDHAAAIREQDYEQFHALLAPMDRVQLNRDTHPEGDLLYHSLQVYTLAKEARDWDEEFLVAALLHDVGKGIDPRDAHEATLTAIQGIVSDRTFWFIEQLPMQHRASEGTLGARARRRLSNHPDGEELRLLAACDSDGRVPGRIVCTLEEAIGELRVRATA